MWIVRIVEIVRFNIPIDAPELSPFLVHMVKPLNCAHTEPEKAHAREKPGNNSESDQDGSVFIHVLDFHPNADWKQGESAEHPRKCTCH